MAGGLDLGAAFFNLGLNVGGLAQGFAKAGSTVAGAVGTVAPGIGKIGESFAKTDEKIGGVMRATERFSRGLRGISPQLGHANEQVYRYEDSLKGLKEQIELTKIRIQERTKAEQDNNAQIQASKQQLDQYRQKWEQLDQALQANQATLAQMRSGAIPATTDQIKQQEDTVRGLEQSLDKLEKQQKKENKTLQEAEGRVNRLSLERQRAEHVLNQQQQSESRYNSLLMMARDRIKAVSERIKEKSEKEKAAKQATQDLANANQRHVGILSVLFGWFSRSGSAVGQMSNAEQRAISISGAFNLSLMKTSTILRDIAVGSIGSFIGNTLANIVSGTQGLITTGLDAYKSYEMLGMSLKALSAREMVATGEFTNLKLAQDAAGEKSKELIDWMQKLAIQSPFSVEDISGAFRLGNALGFTASQTQNLIQKTVDWAAASGAGGEEIKSVIRALGQMNQTGHVTLEDLNQMTDAGLGARDILRNEFAPEIKATGKSLEDLISAGLLPADRAINALSRSIGTDFKDGALNAGDSMTGLLASIGDLKNTALREFLTGTFEAVKPVVSSLVATLQDPNTIGSIQAFGQMLGSGVGEALSWIANVAVPAAIEAFQTFGPMVMDAFAALAAVAEEAYIWGYDIGQMFVDGLAETINQVMSVISWIGETLSSWLAPSSPPKILPELDVWGTRTMQVYLDAMKEADTNTPINFVASRIHIGLGGMTSYIAAMGKQSVGAYFDGWTNVDFSSFNDLKERVSSMLSGMADTGKIDEKGVIPAILGTGDALKTAIDELKSTGSVSEQTFSRIRSAAGDAGDEVESYARTLLNAAQANEAVRRAQEELNALTERYDAQLDPLKKKLDALRGKDNTKGREQEMTRLRMMLDADDKTARDKQKIQNRLDELATEQEISRIEQERDASVNAQESKVKAAELAAQVAVEELNFKQELLNQEKEQNDLIRQQIELVEGKKQQTAEEMAEEDAAAKAKYEFDRASTAEQIALLEAKQAQERQGSKEWYDLQAQIEQKREQLEKEVERNEKAAGDAGSKAEKEEERRRKAEYEARLAAAGSEEERLSIMREEQSRYGEGTVEYLKLQADIEKQTDKVAKAAGKATEAEFEHTLAMADQADKVRLLQERLENLDPASAEYAKRQEQLKKALEAQEKAEIRLSDAQFESQLAGKTRAEQISMLKERLGGLNQGSLEYEKTLKRLNTLEGQEARAGGAGGASGRGGPKGKLKPGPIAGGGPLDELKNIGNVSKAVGDNVNKLSLAFQNAKAKIAEWKEKLEPIFTFLKENSQVIAFVAQRLVGSFAIALTINEAIEPLLKFVAGLGQFVTWGNLAWLALLALGYAWKTNFGGIRDITFEVWNAIQKPLSDIKDTILRVADVFNKDGLKAALDAFITELPNIGNSVADIGTTVFSGILKWTGPLIASLEQMFNDLVAWAKAGGFLRLWNKISETLSSIVQSLGKDGFLSSAAIGAGLLGLAGGLWTVLQAGFNLLVTKAKTEGPGLFQRIGNYLQDAFPAVFSRLMTGLGVALAGLGEALIPTLIFVIKRIIDIAAWLLPMIPDLIGGLVNLVSILLAWILGRGIPMLVAGIIDIGTYLFTKLGEILPEFALKLGMLVGSTITKLVTAIVAGISGLWYQIATEIPPRLQQFQVGLITFVGGFLKGLAGLLLGVMLGIWEPIASIGSDLMRALGDGFLGGYGWVLETISKVFNDAITWVKNLLGISSPSTVFMDIGKNLIQGLVDGLNALKDLLLSTITGMLDSILGFFGTNRDDVLLVFTALKDRTLELAGNIWDGLVGSAGWVTKLVADVSQFFVNLLGFITDPSSGSFTKLKMSALQIATDLWNGLVGTSGFVTKIYNDATRIFDDLKKKAIEIWDGIKSSVSTAADGLKTSLTTTFTGAGTGIVSVIGNAWTTMQTAAKDAWDIARGIPSKVMLGLGVLAGMFTSNFDGENSIPRRVQAGWDSIKNGFVDMWNGPDGILAKLTGAFDSLKGKFKGGINSLIDAANEAIRAANQVPGVNIPEIPKLFKGTQFFEGGPAIVGEQGPELAYLPRGTQVVPTGPSMVALERQMSDMIEVMTNRFMSALEQSNGLGRAKSEVTNNITQTNERHDHWNLTVNTRATTPTVVQDFSTMKVMAGV